MIFVKVAVICILFCSNKLDLNICLLRQQRGSACDYKNCTHYPIAIIMSWIGHLKGDHYPPESEVIEAQSKKSSISYIIPLQWRHNERDDVSTHQRLDCLLNRLFRRGSKKISKLCVTGLCEGNPLMTSGFPSQRASYLENVPIWWRHNVICMN